MKVTFEFSMKCTIKLAEEEDFTLVPIKNAVNGDGTPARVFVKKPGVRNFPVVVNKKGEKFSGSDIASIVHKMQKDSKVGFNLQVSMRVKKEEILISGWDNYPSQSGMEILVSMMEELQKILS